jgi:hypothetical protein
MGNIALILSGLSRKPNLNVLTIFKNKIALFILGLAFIFLSLILWLPKLGMLFNMSNPGQKNLMILLGATGLFFLSLEGLKFVFQIKNKL